MSCDQSIAIIADLKASRSKHFTLQAWHPVVCYVRETLDVFQQISEKFSKVREPVSWTTEEFSLLRKEKNWNTMKKQFTPNFTTRR